MSAASKQGGTEVSYLGVQGSPSLTPLSLPLPHAPLARPLFSSLHPPAPSRFPPRRARSCWRNPTRRGAKRRRACPSASPPARGRALPPRTSARFSFISSSDAAGPESSDLSVSLSLCSVCCIQCLCKFPLCLFVRAEAGMTRQTFYRRRRRRSSSRLSSGCETCASFAGGW